MSVFVEVAGSGPNLTLLHGWGLNGAVWNGIRDALALRYTLHIVDLPGHGLSNGTATATITEMADAIAEAMPPRSHLLGWSLGGLVAQDLARRHAERIDRLVLVATTPSFLQRHDWTYAVQPTVLPILDAGFLPTTQRPSRVFSRCKSCARRTSVMRSMRFSRQSPRVARQTLQRWRQRWIFCGRPICVSTPQLCRKQLW